MAEKKSDFLTDLLSAPKAAKSDRIIACFPGMAVSSRALEERERAYFREPMNALPLPFVESEGECDPLAKHEIAQIEAFNARYHLDPPLTENDWRAINGYEPLATEKDIVR